MEQPQQQQPPQQTLPLSLSLSYANALSASGSSSSEALLVAAAAAAASVPSLQHSDVSNGSTAGREPISCRKAFTDPSNLQRQIRSQNSGARTHACGECGKTFATSSGLKQHTHIHSSIKPFRCEVCQKAYTQFSNLCRHKRMHVKCRTQIKCKKCGENFTTVASLTKHRRFCEVPSTTDPLANWVIRQNNNDPLQLLQKGSLGAFLPNISQLFPVFASFKQENLQDLVNKLRRDNADHKRALGSSGNDFIGGDRERGDDNLLNIGTSNHHLHEDEIKEEEDNDEDNDDPEDSVPTKFESSSADERYSKDLLIKLNNRLLKGKPTAEAFDETTPLATLEDDDDDDDNNDDEEDHHDHEHASAGESHEEDNNDFIRRLSKRLRRESFRAGNPSERGHSGALSRQQQHQQQLAESSADAYENNKDLISELNRQLIERQRLEIAAASHKRHPTDTVGSDGDESDRSETFDGVENGRRSKKLKRALAGGEPSKAERQSQADLSRSELGENSDGEENSVFDDEGEGENSESAEMEFPAVRSSPRRSIYDSYRQSSPKPAAVWPEALLNGSSIVSGLESLKKRSSEAEKSRQPQPDTFEAARRPEVGDGEKDEQPLDLRVSHKRDSSASPPPSDRPGSSHSSGEGEGESIADQDSVVDKNEQAATPAGLLTPPAAPAPPQNSLPPASTGNHSLHPLLFDQLGLYNRLSSDKGSVPLFPVQMPSESGAINALSNQRLNPGLFGPLFQNLNLVRQMAHITQGAGHSHSTPHSPSPHGAAAAAGPGPGPEPTTPTGRTPSAVGHTKVCKEKYSCKFCGKQFPRSANLTRHLRTHTGEQPYKCKYCERSFSISSNLQRHVRNIHNKEKPFKCSRCDRCFGQQTNLDRHLKKHESEHAPPSMIGIDSPLKSSLQGSPLAANFDEIRKFIGKVTSGQTMDMNRLIALAAAQNVNRMSCSGHGSDLDDSEAMLDDDDEEIDVADEHITSENTPIIEEKTELPSSPGTPVKEPKKLWFPIAKQEGSPPPSAEQEHGQVPDSPSNGI